MKKLLLFISALLITSVLALAQTDIAFDQYGNIQLSSYVDFDDDAIVTVLLSVVSDGAEGAVAPGWGIGTIKPINSNVDSKYDFKCKAVSAEGAENEYTFTIAEFKEFAKVDGEYFTDQYEQQGISVNVYNGATRVSVTVAQTGDEDEDETIIPMEAEMGDAAPFYKVAASGYADYDDATPVFIVLVNESGEGRNGWGVGEVVDWAWSKVEPNVELKFSGDNETCELEFTIANFKAWGGEDGFILNIYNDCSIEKIYVGEIQKEDVKLLVDFNELALGAYAAVEGGVTAEIVSAPGDGDGNALQMTCTGYDGVAFVDVVLPEGKTFADVSSISFDVYMAADDWKEQMIKFYTDPVQGEEGIETGNTWIYKPGKYPGNPAGWSTVHVARSDFFSVDTQYGAAIANEDELNLLNSFTIGVGINMNSGTYYIDNVEVKLGAIIPKPELPEEACVELPTTDLGSGWGDATYNAATKTITYVDGWTGKGWWLGTADYSENEEVVVVISECTTTQWKVVVEYAEDNSENMVSAETLECRVALNAEKKNSVKQIYIQNETAGTITLVHAYLTCSEANNLPAINLFNNIRVIEGGIEVIGNQTMVFTIDGRMIANTPASFIALEKGAYLVKVDNNKVQKVIVR